MITIILFTIFFTWLGYKTADVWDKASNTFTGIILGLILGVAVSYYFDADIETRYTTKYISDKAIISIGNSMITYVDVTGGKIDINEYKIGFSTVINSDSNKIVTSKIYHLETWKNKFALDIPHTRYKIFIKSDRIK